MMVVLLLLFLIINWINLSLRNLGIFLGIMFITLGFFIYAGISLKEKVLSVIGIFFIVAFLIYLNYLSIFFY
jgi:hypothetical protein